MRTNSAGLSRDTQNAAALPGDLLSISLRLLLSIAACLIYVGAFYLLHGRLGPGVIALMAIPVAVVGWTFGVRGGIAAGMIGVGMNLFLLRSVGWLDWEHILLGNGLTGSLIILLVGFLLGHVSRLSRRVNQELIERTRAEQRQKSLVALLKSTLEATADGILFVDARGNIALYNQKFIQMWGISPEALRSTSLSQRVEALAAKVRNRNEFIEDIQGALQRPDLEHHFQLHLADGQALNCHAIPHRGENGGQAGGIVLSFQDITDLKQKNEALLKSEKKSRSLIDNSVDGINLLDEMGRVVEWNPAQEAITGLERESVLGQAIWDVLYQLLPLELKNSVHAEDLRLWLREELSKLKDGPEQHKQIERCFRRPDERQVYVEMTLFPIRSDRGHMLGLICRDITDRKLAEEALRERHEMSQTILNAYPDMAVLLDISGRVLAVNEPFARSMGEPAHAIVGRSLASLQGNGAAEARRQGTLEVALTGQPAVREIALGGRYYTDTFYPIAGTEGRVERVALFSHDVTESRQRERELEAVASISSALRAALTRAEVYPIILDQVETLLNTDGIGLILRDEETGEVRVEQARGAWSSMMHMRFSPEQATRGPILILEEPYLNNEIESSHHLFQTRPYSGLKATACVPLEIEGNIIGSLWIGRTAQITQDDVRILSALAHITANAIHRVALYEQTRLYADQLAQAGEIGRELGETLSLNEIYARLSQSIYRMLPNVARVHVTRFEAELQQIVAAYSVQDGKPVDMSAAPRRVLEPEDAGDESRAIQTREAFVKNDCGAGAESGPSPVVQSALFVPLVVKGEALGVLRLESYANHRFGKREMQLLALIGSTAAIAVQNALLFENLQQSHENLTLAYETTLEGWARALDLRDHGTHDHTHRVVELAVELGHRLGMEGHELVNLRRGAQLHDIGKMGVPDSILLKPGPLTEEEWRVMRMHPVYAYEMLYPVPEFRKILDIPYCHHEKWDGSGYPRELKSEDIPLPARIFAVVDVWDALCSDRPYRSAWPEEKVVKYLKSQAGRQFDPEVVDVFLSMVKAEDLLPKR